MSGTCLCTECRQRVFVRHVISGRYLGHHYVQRGPTRVRCDASGRKMVPA